LADQDDLVTEFETKLDKNTPLTGATKTKITYDSDGLVTGGDDATTADIADSSDKRYLTDAQLVVVENTSGTNTGDQDISGISDNATAISNHTSDTTNPHSVTASQVGAEPALGNPSADDYILKSTAAGERSWVAESGGGYTPSNNYGLIFANSDHSALSDSANLTYDSSTGKLLLKGVSSSTADVFALQNSAGDELFEVEDDGKVVIHGKSGSYLDMRRGTGSANYYFSQYYATFYPANGYLIVSNLDSANSNKLCKIGMRDYARTTYKYLIHATDKSTGYAMELKVEDAMADADMQSSAVSIYLDESANELKFKVKYSDGTTYKTGSVSLPHTKPVLSHYHRRQHNMALKKAIELNTGYSPEYHKNVGLNLNTELKTCELTMMAWLDKTAKEAGKEMVPGSVRKLNLTDEQYQDDVVPVVEALGSAVYAIWKKYDPAFTDAVDV